MLYKVYGMCSSTCSLLNPRIRTRARINGKYARNHFCSERVAFKQKRFDIILRKNLTNCFFDLFSMKFILLLSRRICCFCFCAIFLEIACFQCDCIILIAFNFFKFNLVQAACLFDNHHDTIIFRDSSSFRNVLKTVYFLQNNCITEMAFLTAANCTIQHFLLHTLWIAMDAYLVRLSTFRATNEIFNWQS